MRNEWRNLKICLVWKFRAVSTDSGILNAKQNGASALSAVFARFVDGEERAITDGIGSSLQIPPPQRALRLNAARTENDQKCADGGPGVGGSTHHSTRVAWSTARKPHLRPDLGTCIGQPF